MEHQFHFGKKFYLDKKTGYWISTTCPHIRAHVWVWKCNDGNIPKGRHVHHIDGNKSNNSLDNLEMMMAKEHLSLHASTPEHKERSSKWCEEIRPLTKEWHASEEGHKWHVKHGEKTWKERKPIKITCLLCSKVVETKTYHQKFCHPNCKAKYGRRLLKSKIN